MNTIRNNDALTVARLRLQSFTREQWIFAFAILAGVAGGAVAFPASYLQPINVIVGMFLFPFVIVIRGSGRFNIWYLSGLSIFAFLAARYDVKMFYFLALGFYFIFAIEFFIGRTGKLLLFLLAFMSPAFSQVNTIFGFPIRIHLSSMAASILSAAGVEVRAEGSMMVMRGFTFTVDEACMGLSMLSISLMMGILILAHHSRKREIAFGGLLLFFSVALVLNVLANLSRIILLVFFRIMPADPLHEIIGIACLILYVIVPLYFIGKKFIRFFGKRVDPGTGSAKSPLFLNGFMLIIALAIIGTGFSIDRDTIHTDHRARTEIPGLQREDMSGGITKFTNGEILLYTKVIPEFFTGEHTPLICWRGSGYQFEQVRQVRIDNTLVYAGMIVKNDERLHTAWWYTNGEIETVDQLEWRSHMFLNGGSFFLVNVSAADENVLLANVRKMLSTKKFRVTNQ